MSSTTGLGKAQPLQGRKILGKKRELSECYGPRIKQDKVKNKGNNKRGGPSKCVYKRNAMGVIEKLVRLLPKKRIRSQVKAELF